MDNLSYRNNINPKHNLIKLNECVKRLHEQLPLIGEGWASSIYKVESADCGSIVLKIYKNKRKSMNKSFIIISDKQINKEFDKEVYYSKKCIDAVKLYKCPNFMLMYMYDSKNKFILNEYFDGDSSFLFENIFYEKKYYDTYMIQFLIGLLYLENNNIKHDDFRPNNILFKYIDKKILFHYKFDSVEFYVPTFGYLYAIIDFGRSHSLKEKTDKSDIQKYVSYIDRTNRAFHVNQLLKKFTNMTDFMNLFSKIQQKEIINNSSYKNELSSYISYAIKQNMLSVDNSLLNPYVNEMKKILDVSMSLKEILTINFSNYTNYKLIYDDYTIIKFSF